MSAEQDKDPIALKRVRGGESGLDGLGGPSIQLGSPDKKKRKANTQGPSFPPLSEYAPPPNPNADHLVAANPFDDNYSAIAYKPLASPGAYVGPGYPSFGGYGSFRMAPHGPPRMPSPYCGPFALRTQPQPFAQSPAGFPRPPFAFAPPDGAGFGSAPYGPALAAHAHAPGPHFRPSPAESFGQVPPQSAGPAPNPDLASNFVPGHHASFTPPLEPPPPFAPPPHAFGPARAPPAKPDGSPGAKAAGLGPAHPPGGADGAASQGDAAKRAPPAGPAAGPDGGRANGPEPAGPANGTQAPPRPRAPAERAPEKSGKPPALPCRLGRSDPVYPCGICANEVNDDQDAILCEASCQKWFHRVCTGMTETAYGLLTAEAAAVWGCDACMADKDVPLTRAREPCGPAVGREA